MLACAVGGAAMLACGPRPVDEPPEPPGPPEPAVVGSPGDPEPPELPPEVPSFPLACPALYADELLPTFEVELAEADWAALHEDLLQGEEPYYPVVFRHGTDVVPASIRLRGNNSRCGEKLQFAISFDEASPGARYRGLRRIDLDHGGCKVLEERLALSFMRDLGLPTSCANHARLLVNGRYYGLFLSVEHVGKDFLRRNFGGGAANDGNLYKSGWRLRTNEAANDTSDLAAYEAAGDAAAVDALVDLDEALLEWAAEAVLPARDNFWLRGYNYYLYHHPSRGFLFVPTDLDQAFPATTNDVSRPSLLPSSLRHPANLVLADPALRRRYEETLRRAVAAYDPDVLVARLERWWTQVARAAAEDPHAAYGRADVKALEARIRARAEWLGPAVDAVRW